jgi:hypothetical protein
MLKAGELENLNDMIVGACVLCSDSRYGYITEISDRVTDMNKNVCRCRATISYPGVGISFHSYRHDGRSRHDSGHDIVKIVKPDDFKIKSIKIISCKQITIEDMSIANDLSIMVKIAAELGTKKLTGKIREYKNKKFQVWLSKNKNITVKIL